MFLKLLFVEQSCNSRTIWVLIVLYLQFLKHSILHLQTVKSFSLKHDPISYRSKIIYFPSQYPDTNQYPVHRISYKWWDVKWDMKDNIPSNIIPSLQMLQLDAFHTKDNQGCFPLIEKKVKHESIDGWSGLAEQGTFYSQISSSNHHILTYVVRFAACTSAVYVTHAACKLVLR